MCAKSANDSFARVLRRLAQAKNLLVVTHARPDGDAIGSLAALVRASRAAGKTARGLVPDAPPPHYAFLADGLNLVLPPANNVEPRRRDAGLDARKKNDGILTDMSSFSDAADMPAAASRSRQDSTDGVLASPGEFATLAGQADTVVIVDTSALAQLDALGPTLCEVLGKTLVIDHHATGDDICADQWVDPTAAAAGVMVGELLDALGWPVDATTAEALLAAVTTDTGWFRFANVDGRCLRAAARWFDAGVRADTLYRRLFQTDRPERLALLSRMLASMELHADGKLAVTVLRCGDFAAAGARSDETENFVNEALRIGQVELSVLLAEQDDCVRVSFRSREFVNVAELAKQFGGGGHARAAGARVKEQIDALKLRVIAACEAAMKEQNQPQRTQRF